MSRRNERRGGKKTHHVQHSYQQTSRKERNNSEKQQSLRLAKSLNSFNVSGVYLSKRYRLVDWTKDQDPSGFCLQEIYLASTD